MASHTAWGRSGWTMTALLLASGLLAPGALATTIGGNGQDPCEQIAETFGQIWQTQGWGAAWQYIWSLNGGYAACCPTDPAPNLIFCSEGIAAPVDVPVLPALAPAQTEPVVDAAVGFLEKAVPL